MTYSEAQALPVALIDYKHTDTCVCVLPQTSVRISFFLITFASIGKGLRCAVYSIYIRI